jgi:hypothetical protein
MSRNLIWRTRDGRDCQVRQMETDHIRNALSLIKRSIHSVYSPLPGGEMDVRMFGWRTRFIPVLTDELQRRQTLDDFI